MMMYLYPILSRKIAITLFFLFLVLGQQSFSQLVFKNPSIISGNGKSIGSVYRFSQVTPTADALVSIDSIINNAQLLDIDQGGTGFEDALQPKILSGGNGISYILFSIKFVSRNTSVPTTIPGITATNLDLDGNNNLKERCDFEIKEGKAAVISDKPEINVFSGNNHFLGENISGKEYNEIDTSALAVMFKVSALNVSALNVRLGATVINNGFAERQYSVYVKNLQVESSSYLQVSLVNFQAILKDDNTLLNWITTTHTVFDHFVVEKSTNGKDFSEAGIIFSNDQSDSSYTSTYSFKDNLKKNNSSLVYYRLKLADVDGRIYYSETRMIRIAPTASKINITTFPNPVTNEVRILVPLDWQEKKLVYEISNSNGLVVERVINAKASQVQQINVAKFSPGTYFVKVSNGNETAVSKMIKTN